MLNLHEHEEVVLVIHKHWFVMAKTLVVFFVLIIIPPIILTLLPLFTQNLNQQTVQPMANFFLALYIMILFLFLFLAWMDLYLDMWIITNERIIDIEQQGLFRRQMAEIPIKHVQDVTIEIKGVIETFLKFGTIRIQTAGEREFRIDYAPNLYEAKDLILKCARNDKS